MTLLSILTGLGATLVAYNIGGRFRGSIRGTDAFAEHTARQRKRHPFSGMHEPFIPTKTQQEFFQKYFPQHSHLLPRSKEAIQQQHSLATPVKISSLSNCPIKKGDHVAKTVVVGGPPALISSVNEHNIIYINDERRPPIAFGSAWHLEWDGESEAPTTYRPSKFMRSQILRALLNNEKLGEVENSGHFSWRTLDWIGWLQHPKQWGEGFRIALAFQNLAKKNANRQVRATAVQEVGSRCKANQRYYEHLNAELGERLLSKGKGAIIVARTPDEKIALMALKEALAKEGREIRLISADEIKKRHGFVPKGIAFGEKTHDRTLATNFMQLLKERIKALGGNVINGTLTAIFTDKPEEGGVVEYTTGTGEVHFIPFSKLVLSLGSQRIFGTDGKPLFDIISARGVSVLAVGYLPHGHSLPPVIVCGGSNHVTKLSNAVSVMKGGQPYDAYLLSLTAGACITPTVSEHTTAHYEATVATGLIAAARKTLNFEIEVMAVFGTNRQVSEHGESHWLTLPQEHSSRSLFSTTPRGHFQDLGTHRPTLDRGIFIQMGTGGGGLTQAPSQPPATQAP